MEEEILSKSPVRCCNSGKVSGATSQLCVGELPAPAPDTEPGERLRTERFCVKTWPGGDWEQLENGEASTDQQQSWPLFL